MLHNRGALFTLDAGTPTARAAQAAAPHDHPGFMEKDDVRIGFGIMGGWNQAQAHAQFVADIADFGIDVQEALEAGRFTKATFERLRRGRRSARARRRVRKELAALGHQVRRCRRAPARSATARPS